MFAPCVWDPREAGKGRGFCQNLGPQPVDWSLKEEVPVPGDPEPAQEAAAGWWPRGDLRMLAGIPLDPACTPRVDSEPRELKAPLSAFHSDHYNCIGTV